MPATGRSQGARSATLAASCISAERRRTTAAASRLIAGAIQGVRPATGNGSPLPGLLTNTARGCMAPDLPVQMISPPAMAYGAS